MQSTMNKLLRYSLSNLNKPFYNNSFRLFSNINKYNYVTVTQDGYIKKITLSRPELHNSFNESLIEEITSSFKLINPQETRVVIFSAEGKSFSAGADINWMKKMAQYTEAENLIDADKLFEMISSIQNCPCPVIGRINGSAFGGGVGLVAACDFAFALSSAKFAFTEVKIGIIPAVISKFVYNKIGSNIFRFFLTGERFDAPTAAKIGLIQDSFATLDELDSIINQSCQEILACSPQALRVCKELNKYIISQNSIDDCRKYSIEAIAKIRVSKEGQEGLTSFLEKRKPWWFSK